MMRIMCIVGFGVAIALGAGAYAAPPGENSAPAISGTTISTTGTWTCHINDASDKVEMTASAHDYDTCQSGDRIDLSLTQWSVPQGWGTFEHQTGESNSWTAGSQSGQTAITVTFDDKEDDPDEFDDLPAEKQQDVTAFKVGISMAHAGFETIELWEGESKPLSERTITHTITDKVFGEGDIGGHAWADDEYDRLSDAVGPVSKTSTATWKVITSPPDTSIKKYIRGTVGAKGVGGRIRACAQDDVGNNNGSVSITLGCGSIPVGIGYSFSLDNTNVGAVAGIGAAFYSAVHDEGQEWKVEVKSDDDSQVHDAKDIDHDFSTAHWDGKTNDSKQGQWKISGWANAKSDGGFFDDWSYGGFRRCTELGGSCDQDCVWWVVSAEYVAAQ